MRPAFIPGEKEPRLLPRASCYEIFSYNVMQDLGDWGIGTLAYYDVVLLFVFMICFRVFRLIKGIMTDLQGPSGTFLPEPVWSGTERCQVRFPFIFSC